MIIPHPQFKKSDFYYNRSHAGLVHLVGPAFGAEIRVAFAEGQEARALLADTLTLALTA